MSTVTHIFEPAQYDLPIPIVDGVKADKLALVLTGQIDIERTDAKALELLNSFKLGDHATITVQAVCVGKPSTYKPGSDETDGSLSVRTVLRITSITH